MSNVDKEQALKLIYFGTLAGASILFGFSKAFGGIKKKHSDIDLAHHEARQLAMKALKRATLYSCVGFGIFSVISYTLVGKKLIANFKEKHRNEETE